MPFVLAASLLFVHGIVASGATFDASLGPVQRACSVFCAGEILETVQARALFNDSKTFVDMPLLADPEDVWEAWAGAGGATMSDAALEDFLSQYFGAPGSDLEAWTPPDFSPNPPFLATIANATLRQFASDVNAIWKELGRQVGASVAAAPQRHTLLPLPHPTIVAGGRFREVYYWDSWFIVVGLLRSGLVDTARGHVLNLAALASDPRYGDGTMPLGFVPNGGRAYYTNRSQPPLLALMVSAVYNATKDAAFLAATLPALDLEYGFWMAPCARCSAVQLGAGHTLNRYVTNWTLPRPEGWQEDVATAKAAGYAPSSPAAQALFKNIAAMAESGWDFSSRWLNSTTLASTDTSDVVPVDLNAILYRVEVLLGELHDAAGSPNPAYQRAASARAAAMEAVLWSEDAGCWLDYRLSAGVHHEEAAASNYVPLWAGAFDVSNDTRVGVVVDSLSSSGLLQVGGVVTTLQHTGQQWDWPNAWPPLQHFLIKGLAQFPRGVALAESLATRWITSGALAFNRTGYMYEKYAANAVGEGGGGGEYTPQEGFGWTNGVMLDLLCVYAGGQ